MSKGFITESFFGNNPGLSGNNQGLFGNNLGLFGNNLGLFGNNHGLLRKDQLLRFAKCGEDALEFVGHEGAVTGVEQGLDFGVFFHEILQLAPGRLGTDVGEIDLCQLHSADSGGICFHLFCCYEVLYLFVLMTR